MCCSYRTEDGQKRQEKGKVRCWTLDIGQPGKRLVSIFICKVNSGSMVTRGGWEYVGSDGRLYKVKHINFSLVLLDFMVLFQTEFIADELGYRPVGEHIHPAFVQVDN